MKKFCFVAVLAVAAVGFSGCAGGSAPGTVDMTGSICVAGVCVSAPTVRQAAPVVPDRVVYERALVASRGAAPVMQRSAPIIAVQPLH